MKCQQDQCHTVRTQWSIGVEHRLAAATMRGALAERLSMPRNCSVGRGIPIKKAMLSFISTGTQMHMHV